MTASLISPLLVREAFVPIGDDGRQQPSIILMTVTFLMTLIAVMMLHTGDSSSGPSLVAKLIPSSKKEQKSKNPLLPSGLSASSYVPDSSQLLLTRVPPPRGKA
jgi:hypothetical protein